MKIAKVCKYCKKEFKVSENTVKKGYGIYCSRICRDLNNKTNITILNCLYCGRPFEVKGYLAKNDPKYCSHFCQLQALKKGENIKCKNCGESFTVDLNVVKKGHGKYCSLDCAIKTFPTRMQIKPNYSEKKLYKLINFLFPNEYHLNVLGEFIIDRKIPDFVNINGQKKIIELFGEHVHPIEHENIRKDVFAKFGYKTLIIWCKELKDEQLLKEKLIEFNNSKTNYEEFRKNNTSKYFTRC
jgi:very-short-patch-repair endonuclease